MAAHPNRRYEQRKQMRTEEQPAAGSIDAAAVAAYPALDPAPSLPTYTGPDGLKNNYPAPGATFGQTGVFRTGEQDGASMDAIGKAYPKVKTS